MGIEGPWITKSYLEMILERRGTLLAMTSFYLSVQLPENIITRSCSDPYACL